MEKKNIRIVTAVSHNDTGELEIILEVTRDMSNFIQEIELKSVWIDSEKLLEMSD